MEGTFIVVFYLALSAIPCEMTDPTGHMLPLGSHRPALRVDVRDTVPDPVEFFTHYVKPGRPVILRGAAKTLPNYNNWKSDEYLRTHFGQMEVRYMAEKKEISSEKDRVYVPTNLEGFLNVYKAKESYLGKILSSEDRMAADMAALKCMACGGFKENVRTITVFFSSGGTKSALHRDEIENLNCLIDGAKEWVLFDRKVAHMIPADSDIAGYSTLDVEKVDLHKYSSLQQLPWYYAKVNTGDCIFVPFGFPHHVISTGSRNMAVNVWWSFMREMDLTDCPENLSDLPETSPFTKFGAITPVENIKISMLSFFIDKDNETLTESEFVPLMLLRGLTEEEGKEFFHIVDADSDGLVTPDEVMDDGASENEEERESDEETAENTEKEEL